MTIPTITRQYFYPQPQLGSHDNLVIQEVRLSPPKSNEVLVKTHAVSLQFRDLLVASGKYPGLTSNLVPCSDMAGEVIAVGEDVKHWKTGDRVCANFMLDKLHAETTTEIAATALGGAVQGVLTEYRTFPAHSLVAIPSHFSYEEASTLPCAALTAYNALLSGFDPLKAGDTVLVQGTGGVSIFALQFAVASGATVIATSSSNEKLKVATKLGAKHVINYRTTPNWDEEVLKFTNGVGVDHVIEIRGIYVGSVDQFKNMNRLIAANVETTRPVIDKVFAFEEAKAAFAHLQSQTHVGKVVIKV
ncbi:alcohol dehydrogenase superfamily protein [Mycena galericulata]|nr:alcohol dehydrogenase superfamily protein [Mycena galericulata]